LAGLGVDQWLRRLGAREAVQLARELIFAEAGRLDLPLGDFEMSGRVTVGDEGIDGRTRFPETSATHFPRGPHVWQVKSGPTEPRASDEFRPEHRGLLNAVRKGWGYVLFWTFDPIDSRRDAWKTKFRDDAQQVVPGLEPVFLLLEDIERMANRHPAVLLRAGAVPHYGVLRLETWGEPLLNVEFSSDEQRDSALQAIRAHVTSEDSTDASIHIFGDTGVGKSRVVYEALARDGTRERAVVAPSYGTLNLALLTHVAETDNCHLILMVDDCTPEQVEILGRAASYARGRLRLVTAGNRWDRRAYRDARTIELPPLRRGAIEHLLAESEGLPSGEARLVAQFTQGYPGLAVGLAREIRFGAGTTDLMSAIRGRRVGPILDRMLPDTATRQQLSVLALFEQLGFDEELAPETQIVCSAFAINEADFRRAVRQEENRYVSSAGRYRLITPRLFAIWLAHGFMRSLSTSILEPLSNLTRPLLDAFLNQMQAFAGDELVASVVAEILEASPFLERHPADLDVGATRLLQIAALIDPPLATQKLQDLFLRRDIEELRAFDLGRRNLIWTLEFLVWLPESFDTATRILFDLACAENETWSNNATGVFTGLFAIHLGGTSVPHADRLEWLRRHYRDHGSLGIPLAIKALQQALSIDEFRTEHSYGSRIVPPEWRPQSINEEIHARRASWRFLLDIARTDATYRNAVAETLGQSIQMVIARGLGDDVVDDLPGISWTPEERAHLAQGVSASLRSGSYPPEYRERLEAVLADLRGSSLDDVVKTTLSSDLWELARSEQEEGSSESPSAITSLAEQLAQQPQGYIGEVAAQSINGNDQTAFVLFRELGRRTSAAEPALDAVTRIRPIPAAALVGLLAGASQTLGDNWTDDRLKQWLTVPELGGLIPRASHMVSSSAKRAQLSVAAVERGYCDPMELGRFVFGAWAKDLPEPALLQILGVLARSESAVGLENALGILGQWLGEGHTPTASLVSLAENLLDLSIDAATARVHGMDAFYRGELIGKLELSFDVKLRLVLKALDRQKFPDEHDIAILTDLCQERPEAVASAVVSMIVAAISSRGAGLKSSWLQEGRLLSRLETMAGTEVVRELVLSQPPDLWPELVDHLKLDTDEPDPVLVAMIERNDDPALWSRAVLDFMYPAFAWSGSESALLAERINVAERWLQGPFSQTFKSWIAQAIEATSKQLESARRREAEGF
jgi:hypothetical protein